MHYFNTLSTRTYPHLRPITPRRTHPLVRALPEGIPEDEELQAILLDLVHQNNSIIHDIIDQDLTSDFDDIFNSTEDHINVAVHPLINKTLYLIPGVHFEETTENYSTTTLSLKPTYVFELTKVESPVTDVNLRMTKAKESLVYELDASDNYESAPKEHKSPASDSAYADSREPKREYFHKFSTKYSNHLDATTEKIRYKMTQPLYEDGKPGVKDDWSADVEFDV